MQCSKKMNEQEFSKGRQIIKIMSINKKSEYT